MGAIETPPRPPARILLAIALVAGCTLGQQVLLTRLFSAAVFYHFSFLAVSLALVGSGAGAILVYVKPAWFERMEPERVLARWTAGFAILLSFCPILLVRLDYRFSFPASVHFAANLGAACLIAALPFLAAGVVLALAIKIYAGWIGVTYAADLAGAGLGAFLIVPPLWVASAPTLMMALGVLAAWSCALFAPPRRPERRAGVYLTVLAVGVTALSAATSLTYLPPPGSPFEKGFEQIADRWTPISRVLGYTLPKRFPCAMVMYDRVGAPVFPHRPGDPPPTWRSLSLGPQSIGYELTGPGNALIIGGGGGRDILNALSSGQRDIDVIELNEGVRRVVNEDMAAYSGSPYSLPGVHTIIGDGRSVLARSRKKYTQIHISFTDTFSGNSASAFALTESNLYTLEAFEQYFDHLAPRGILNLSRPYLVDYNVGPLRLAVLALEALRRRGVSDPRRNVVVIYGADHINFGADIIFQLYGTVLARLEPFSDAELARIKELVAQRGVGMTFGIVPFTGAEVAKIKELTARHELGIAFGPNMPEFAEWAALANAPAPMDFCANFFLNVCPPTDDQPFFFNATRLGNIGRRPPQDYVLAIDPMLILMMTLGILVILAILGCAVPLIAVRGIARPPLSSWFFFAAIGVGYMVLEMALIQRFVLFLGFPTYALSVVLFALLVFTGVGSLLSQRFQRPKSALMASLAAATALIAVSAATLQPLLRQLILLDFALRAAISIALIAPFGIAMGMAMPIGLRRMKALYPSGVPYAFGVNGIASVVGSVLAVAVAVNFGFTIASLIAAACYLAALAHTALVNWPQEQVEESGLEHLRQRVLPE